MCFPPPVFSFVVLQFPETFSHWERNAFCLAEDCPVFEHLRSPLVSLGDFFLLPCLLKTYWRKRNICCTCQFPVVIIEKAMGSLLGLRGV